MGVKVDKGFILTQIPETENMSLDTKTTIRNFFAKHFQAYDITDDDDIFAMGLVNSLFAMQLVLFVEQAFSLTIENEDMDLDNFRSINALNSLIQRKQQASL